MLSSIKKFGLAGDNSLIKWRFVDNFAPSVSYWANRPKLSGEAGHVVKQLNRDGIAVSSVRRLFGNDDHLHSMKEVVQARESELASEIEEARARAGQVEDEKSFLFFVLGERPRLHSVFGHFFLEKPILDIANAYFNMFTRFSYFNVWKTFATQTPPQRSQLWHRDRDDIMILKVFVYLSHIDEGAGPFCYAPGTHRKGSVRDEPQSFLEKNRRNPRSSDEQMAAVVAPKDWVICTGNEGTIVFADTFGYHKGGLARNTDRLLLAGMFVSSASRHRPDFDRGANLVSNGSKEIRYALAL